MQRDHGWIHTLLEEAENERMHLMTFLQLRKPGVYRLHMMWVKTKWANRSRSLFPHDGYPDAVHLHRILLLGLPRVAQVLSQVRNTIKSRYNGLDEINNIFSHSPKIKKSLVDSSDILKRRQ